MARLNEPGTGSEAPLRTRSDGLKHNGIARKLGVVSDWAIFYASGAILGLGLVGSIIWLRQSGPASAARFIVVGLGLAFVVWTLWLGLIVMVGDTDFYD